MLLGLCPFLGAFAKLRKAIIIFVMSVCLSVCPSVLPSFRLHGTTWLPLDGLWWNLIFGDYSKICRENLTFTKNGHEWKALYMTTKVHILSYLAHLFLEWEMFQTKLLQKIKTRILCSVTFLFENRAAYEIMWKNAVERGRSQKTIWRMSNACWIRKAIYTHTQVA